MRKFIVCLILLSNSLYCCAQKDQITTFILVRHAEKADDGTDDPDLKAIGVERAQRLALMLKETKLDAIYSTKYKRAKNTAQPVADQNGLTVSLYEAFKADAIETMIKDNPGGTILVTGHSNNIPWIANLLLGREEYKNFADDDYGNFLIISVVEKGKKAQVTWLNY